MRKILPIIFALLLFLFQPQKTFASEGIIELKSTTQEKYRCFVFSVLMPDANHTLLYSCRDLVYPIGAESFAYVLWAQPIEGKPTKLGSLGVGKGEFKTKTPFTQLFVTTETNAEVREPRGQTVMRGEVLVNQFLERLTPTPTLQAETLQTVTPTPRPTTAPLSTREKFTQAFKRAGLAAFLALISLIGLIFVITRAK